jgi:uncharacterized membrane protein YjjP (DUF1212 family)
MSPPSLDEVARLSLSVGKLLLETGASARSVHEAVEEISEGLGCKMAETYCQHAAIIVMLRRDTESCVRMGKVGEHGVNLQRAEALDKIVRNVALGEMDCVLAQREVDNVPRATPGYPVWFVCLATGLACAAFGRLLNATWLTFVPTLAAAAAGQWLRHALLERKQNVFLVVGTVSFFSALIAGLGGRLLGSEHLEIATTAAVLLLVPGVAVLNAQLDVIGGRPNLAAARGLRVAYLLLFMTLGLVFRATVGCSKNMSPASFHLLHQAFFGGVAAAGFGVLFNSPPRLLSLGFAFGALALAVRTGRQELGGLGLPAASFIAALVLSALNRILEQPDSPRGSVLAVIGCIPMIPGSLAAKGFDGPFRATQIDS